MKKGIYIILLFIFSNFFILEGAEYFLKGNENFVKVKGMLKLVNENEDFGCGRLTGMMFYAENEKDFEGKYITLYGDDINYYNENDKYLNGIKDINDIYLENEKLIKKTFPNKYKQIYEKIDKNIPVEIPVIITINLKNIKTYSECDHTTIYTKVEKIEEIDKVKKRKKISDDTVTTYIVYSKDGYANMRQNPNIKSKVIKKIENEIEYLDYILSVGEWYYFYINGFWETESYGGFIHKSQVKRRYTNFIIESKEGYTNVREEENSKSKIITRLKNGEKVDVIDDEGEWILIYLTDIEKRGYIHRSQLKIIE